MDREVTEPEGEAMPEGETKDKLPLTSFEKMNCAWRLVANGNGSKAQP